MKKVWAISIISVNLILILLILRRFYPLPLILPYLIGIAYLALLVYGSAFIGSEFYVPALCRKVTNEKVLALTFDDHPAGELSHKVLDILQKCQIQATFFCIGKRIPDNEEVLKRIDKEGHLIGNHSYGHSNTFGFFPQTRMLKELEATNDLICKIIGKKPKLFRPPFGVTNPALHKALLHTNFLTIGWSIRSLDTIIADEKKLSRRICKRLHPGAVVLMHERHPGMEFVLNDIITFAEKQGYRFIRLDKLFNIEPYEA